MSLKRRLKQLHRIIHSFQFVSGSTIVMLLQVIEQIFNNKILFVAAYDEKERRRTMNVCLSSVNNKVEKTN
jgi:hypothetical protein